MSRIKFNQPKYVIPILMLPFLLLFFYVYKEYGPEPETQSREKAGMQEQVGNASTEVQKSAFDDKLQAFNEQYKEADGNSAVNPISDADNRDSIERQLQQKFLNGNPGTLPYNGGLSTQQQGMQTLSRQDQDLGNALSGLQQGNYNNSYSPSYASVNSGQYQPPLVKEKDPMEMFKAQMAYIDSVNKAADPEYKAEMQRKQAQSKVEEQRKQQPKLKVQKEGNASSAFNTLLPGKKEAFITAIIDENITGYSGSRIRLRLLEDIRAGNTLVSKGTYLYALINGFGDQRVTLSVQSIFLDGKILPVKLDLYDTDGLQGLYVPESAFREFTKDLGGNAMQGVNLQGNSTDANQFLMSSVDKVFQSTSIAIANLIRKNKAKIKYNSYIYLIDPEALQNAQKNY